MNERKRKAWVTVRRACRYFPGREGGPCSLPTIYRLVRRGKVRTRRTFTGRLFVSVADLRALWGEPQRREG